MKILFVDDEPRILSGIERMLFDMADEWDMIFAESGAQALEHLENNSVDVIVSDMRMPVMDGAELLKQVQAHYPTTVRIILSGHTDLEAALRAVPVAHQFLSKPCDPDLLKSVIMRTCCLQSLLRDGGVREVIGELDKLPSVPRIYSELVNALADNKASAPDVAKIISQDLAISARILQIVNSAFFGGSGLTNTIQEAVVRLGIGMIKSLILSIEVFQNAQSFNSVPGFSIDEMQKHALVTATLAKKLLNDQSIADDVFMAALLHDIGKLVMLSVLPEQFEAVLRLAESNDMSFYLAEQELMGLSHAEIGGYLLGVWGLPYSIVEAVANHHDPTRVPGQTGFGIVEAVYVANTLAGGEALNANYLVQWGVLDQLEAWQALALEP